MHTTLLLQWLSIFFLISLYVSATNSASTSPPPVLDISGKPLRAGVKYYILPLIRGRGGGLTLASSSKNKPCPLDQVVQESLEVKNGLPVTFSPVNTTKSGLVRESTDLNIKFSAATICVQSTIWKLGTYDETSKNYFLTTGGVEGNPGRETISNWFKIEKFGDRDYKLVFCPTVCNYCKVICKEVGIYYDQDGKRRLALTDDQPFPIMFKKA